MIAYHGSPCGGPRQETARFLAGRHAMVPFPRPDDLGIALEVCQTVALDNGAYSVWRQGGQLDVPGYHDWVASVMYHPAFAWAVIPDVIGISGTEADNDRLIAEWPWGDRGVPVWHLHESLGRLRALCGAWPLVALGSSGKWSTPGTSEWWMRMAEAMEVVCGLNAGRPITKLHGLRMLNPEIFRRLPLASADSTNAVRNGNLFTRFGSYPPPTLGQRQAVIADRIEAYQSAACWVPLAKDGLLFQEEESLASD